VTSIPLIINRLLIPALPVLYSGYPRLKLEAIAEPRNVSLTRRDADIALRLARPEREQKVIARRVGMFAYAVYGPSSGEPRSLPWITYEDGMESLPHVVWIDNAIKREGGEPASLKVNDSEVALHAIRAGIGKSLLPCVIGDADPKLARLSGAEPVLSRELWLLVHPEIRSLARTKAVMAWLGDVISGATRPKARSA
jgi:DNA-binding transcriptional LysR family regulator